ncbi:tetratricopeptide repeat protein [Achromobacter xylosoxidans]|uniref:tetratricopeptide repeat protein n=1 Tax=Alcaligenes xylosoxydans xylosoxydans TaxID=85698 RepID=UPI001F1471AA|nr:tetratricopeptide repeat protein [Achromobacter xylosoxidans]
MAANILSSALSETGRYAVCQTANAPSSDGNRFIAFDVRRKTELFSVAPEAGWAERYVFKDDPVRFGVVVPQVGTFFYDLNGHLLDAERMSAARLASESYTVAIPAAEELMKTPALSEEQVRSALETAERVLLLDPPIDIGWRAAALKVKGIALDHLGEHGAALLAFDEALGINPKIGVKRRADALRKRFA